MRAGPTKLLPADKMQKMRLWFERNEGIPPKRDTRPGFDMGIFWNDCCSGCNKDLFAVALSKSSKMKAAHKARLEGKLPGAKFSPAQKMQKMRLWFEHNEGIPPRGDTRPGFDMGAFWNHCCSGYNKALFAAALLKSPKMNKAHDSRIARKKTTPAARKRRRNPTISSDESEGESDGAREEATWIDGVPVWSRCVPRMSA